MLGQRSILFGLPEALVEPTAGVGAGLAAEAGFQLPVIGGAKGADLFFPLDHDGERRRLHPADRGQVETAGLGVEGGHRPGAVDADQPVALGAAHGRFAQAFHVRGGAQLGETVTDRAGRHRLQPQALHRLVGAGMLGDETEDQLPLAARVTGVDQAGDILALDQTGE